MRVYIVPGTQKIMPKHRFLFALRVMQLIIRAPHPIFVTITALEPQWFRTEMKELNVGMLVASADPGATFPRVGTVQMILTFPT